MAVQLVIGAGGGIGGALARRLHDRGDTVVLAGRTAGPVEELADELGQPWHQLDATDFDAVKELVDGIVDEHGQLDGATNCAGSVVLKPAHLTTADDFHDIVATNLTTAFSLVRAAAPAMRSTGGAIALVSTDRRRATSILDKADQFVESMGTALIVRVDRDLH